MFLNKILWIPWWELSIERESLFQFRSKVWGLADLGVILILDARLVRLNLAISKIGVYFSIFLDVAEPNFVNSLLGVKHRKRVIISIWIQVLQF